VRGAFGALGGIHALGFAVAAVLVAGAVVVLRSRGIRALRSQLAAPTALLAGAPIFFLLTSMGRRSALFSPTSGRYLYIAVLFLLPAIAVGADALIARARAMTLLLLALFVVAIPPNLDKASDFANRQAQYAASVKAVMLSITSHPLARNAPPDLEPDPNLAPDVTMRWLRAGQASGRIPVRPTRNPTVAASNLIRLSLYQTDQPVVGSRCKVLRVPVIRDLATGESFGIRGGEVLVSKAPPEPSPSVQFGTTFLNPSPEHTVTAVAPLKVRIRPGLSYVRRVSLC
jgi:hypothetical protein